jgi:hypothetical protein
MSTVLPLCVPSADRRLLCDYLRCAPDFLITAIVTLQVGDSHVLVYWIRSATRQTLLAGRWSVHIRFFLDEEQIRLAARSMGFRAPGRCRVWYWREDYNIRTAWFALSLRRLSGVAAQRWIPESINRIPDEEEP